MCYLTAFMGVICPGIFILKVLWSKTFNVFILWILGYCPFRTDLGSDVSVAPFHVLVYSSLASTPQCYRFIGMEDWLCWMFITDVPLGPLNLFLGRRVGYGNATKVVYHSGASAVYLLTLGPSHNFNFLHISVTDKVFEPTDFLPESSNRFIPFQSRMWFSWG